MKGNRPLCSCHDRPTWSNGHGGRRCAVKATNYDQTREGIDRKDRYEVSKRGQTTRGRYRTRREVENRKVRMAAKEDLYEMMLSALGAGDLDGAVALAEGGVGASHE